MPTYLATMRPSPVTHTYTEDIILNTNLTADSATEVMSKTFNVKHTSHAAFLSAHSAKILV